ncbi:YqgE/AlgH family protein [Reichenbachiella versicolor]|uniref:YqgE/AlgH family protein n=1 Tax=Reichenbachiella versicolor TaxID=1821036 RepID=UPI000D6E06C6|nr:YqgE/AlgH family protein [Reichenbachiella versicolor]
MDYFHPFQNLKPEKGDLLISEPYLPDPNFDRTVVLICEHDNEGTFGYVLNQNAEVNFGEIVKQVEGFEHPIHIGGPVQQDTLHFIHRCEDKLLGGQEINEGLFWGGDYDRLIELINIGLVVESDFKFFIGYSGWGTNQLQDEINQKSWFIYKNPLTTKLFDIPSDMLWKSILEDLGGKFKMISKYPTDPRLN